jgi:hypothetical protein
MINTCISFLKINILKKINKNMINTCFPEEDNHKKKWINTNININTNTNTNTNTVDEFNKPLYTLIWYDCDKCFELLEHMDNLNLKKLYINGSYYFYDILNEGDEFNSPLLYKDDELIGDNLFDIYSEIYSN